MDSDRIADLAGTFFQREDNLAMAKVWRSNPLERSGTLLQLRLQFFAKVAGIIPQPDYFDAKQYQAKESIFYDALFAAVQSKPAR